MNRVIKILVVGLGYIALGYHSGHAVKDGYKSVPEEVDARNKVITAQVNQETTFQRVQRIKQTWDPQKIETMKQAAAKNLERDAARGFFYREQIERAQEKIRLEKEADARLRAQRENQGSPGVKAH